MLLCKRCQTSIGFALRRRTFATETPTVPSYTAPLTERVRPLRNKSRRNSGPVYRVENALENAVDDIELRQRLHRHVYSLVHTRELHREQVEAEFGRVLDGKFAHVVDVRILNQILYYYFLVRDERRSGMSFLQNVLLDRCEPSRATFNIILQHLAQHAYEPGDQRSPAEFVEVLRQMDQLGLRPDHYTWAMILRLVRASDVLNVLRFMARSGMEATPHILTTVMKKIVDKKPCAQWLEESLSWDMANVQRLAMVNVVLNEAINRNELDAEEIFAYVDRMEAADSSFAFDHHVYSRLLRRARHIQDWALVRRVLRRLYRKGLAANEHVFASLLPACLAMERYDEFLAIVKIMFFEVANISNPMVRFLLSVREPTDFARPAFLSSMRLVPQPVDEASILIWEGLTGQVWHRRGLNTHFQKLGRAERQLEINKWRQKNMIPDEF